MDKFNNPNITNLSMYDLVYPDEEYNSDNIKLLVSKDENIYYNKDSALEEKIHNDTLVLRWYTGEIYVPKNMTLMITTSRNLEGKIFSPTHIRSDANIDINIDSNSLLELIYKGYGPMRFNSKTLMPSYEEGQIIPTRMGQDFSVLEKEYYDYLNKIMKSPVEISQEYGIGTDFENAKFEAYIIDICRHFNLAYIEKNGGLSNIFYNGPIVLDHNDKRSRNILLEKMHKQEELERKIKYREQMDTSESYRQAGIIKKELEDHNKKLEVYKKKIISKHQAMYAENGKILHNKIINFYNKKTKKDTINKKP